MLLIPSELEPYYYIACLVVSAMALSVILINRHAQFMSRHNTGFFYLVACGIFIDGIFGFAGTGDPRLHMIAFAVRTGGLFAWVISIFVKTIFEALAARRQFHAG